MGTIYIIENKINGMCYVGQTTQSFNDRFRQHNQSHSYIGNALRKHGVANFNRILLENISEDKMDEVEKECIVKYNAIYPNGYNLQDGGCGNKHQHPETKQKLSKIQEGKMVGELNPFFGKHHTDESNMKNAAAHTGKIGGMNGIAQTDEARHLMSIAKKGNTYRRGSHHTEEAKEKNRLAHLGVIPVNKGIRVPHLCPVCKNPVKEKYGLRGEFQGYQKSCGNFNYIKSLRKVKLLV
jgi:group I intron endonuclease